MTLKSEIIQKEIDKKKADLDAQLKLEANHHRSLAIRELSDITPEEKIKEFDLLYESAKTMLDGRRSESDEHYAWEDVMCILAKDKIKFWEYYNNIEEL